MKDSGVEWISLIPKSWKRTYLLNGLRQPITDGPHETPEYLSNKNGIPFISVDSLNDSENVDLINVKKYISENDYEKYNLKTNLEENDILFSKAATIGKTAIVKKERFMVWSPLAIIKCNNNILYYKYLYHVLNCNKYIVSASNSGTKNTQINVGMRSLEKSYIPLPPLSEQQKIADFLDEKVKEIDNAIEKTKESIELYKKYKQAIITEAVTKGLDPNVEMKDSGIEWIGQMPVNRKIIRLKQDSYTKGRIGWQALKADEFTDEGPYCITGTDFENGHVNWNTCYHVTEERYEMDPFIQVKAGDLLITKDGTIGKLAIIDSLPDKACLNSHLLLIRPMRGFWITEYLYWILASDVFKKYYNLTSTGSIMDSLSQEKIRNFAFPICEIQLQKQIADYLNTKCSKLDNIIDAKSKIITELESYKKSLIYEYVTGKKEVE